MNFKNGRSTRKMVFPLMIVTEVIASAAWLIAIFQHRENDTPFITYLMGIYVCIALSIIIAEELVVWACINYLTRSKGGKSRGKTICAIGVLSVAIFLLLTELLVIVLVIC